MSRRRKDEKPGYARLLDAWTPPSEAGEALGCVATSFTFSSVFFEEECLGRFVGLETDAVEDGAAFLVEREEKFAQLVCATALVDQRHARGLRSLRWDLLAARVPKGILHAKVSLLLWTNAARLIVASANLTDDGYRRNHEVFGVLDYAPGGEAPLALLHDALAFLDEVVRLAEPKSANTGPAVARWQGFLARARSLTREWGASATPRGTVARVFAAFTGPSRPSLFAQLRDLWPTTTPPNAAYVVSPFFDPPEAVNTPAREIWPLLRQRGEVTVCYAVTAEDDEAAGTILLHAPKSLAWTPAGRSAVVSFERLKIESHRPLHAKCLWFDGPEWFLYSCGSSNFTSAGLGVSAAANPEARAVNFEANLVYAVNHARNSEANRSCNDAWLPHEALDPATPVKFLPPPNADEEETGGVLLLPEAFSAATFIREPDGSQWIELIFQGVPKAGWLARVEDEDAVFISQTVWEAEGQPKTMRLLWPPERRPPAGFRVSWVGVDGSAWWPVNVRDAASLPPPAELSELPLEVLIEILTSAQPLHLALARWLRKSASAESTEAPLLDPHRRVDTSSFLLQRTRRVSWAFAGLRARLERPVASRETLEWRLRGPVGVQALARAISKEAHSAEERTFLLVELMLELARVRPLATPGGLPTTEVKAALRALIAELRATLAPESLKDAPALSAYVAAATAAAP